MEQHKKEVQSINEEQKQGNKISKILDQNPVKRFFNYLFLSTNDKKLFHKLSQERQAKLTNDKKTFNKNNVFELDNFDF
jgi:hypothetical protein